MPKTDPRIDAYIANSADFAKPILKYIRAAVHEACPQVEEDMKWRNPTFMYKGILCGMGAFKEHAIFGFWKGTLIIADKGKSLEAMGSFGRITKVSDLPSKKILIGYVKQAMALNEQGVKAPVKHDKPKKPVRVPPYLSAALKKNKKALATFENFSPSHKREYIEWVTEAKTEETRNKRLQTAVEWIAQGKGRNWKYMKK
ncbi:MAG: YdeI/OmpD-associated family protein [Ignavibacteriae bacterium]|nr:YdeI/OmpD-associated family protein [Ignavibacteriota bacterium]